MRARLVTTYPNSITFNIATTRTQFRQQFNQQFEISTILQSNRFCFTRRRKKEDTKIVEMGNN